MEEPEVKDIENMESPEECDVCGGDHFIEQCPELGLGTTVGPHAVSRARLTMPNNMMLAETGALLHVFATEDIKAKTQFGPFEAKKTTQEFSDSNLFTLKILIKDGASVSLDTSDENECNWLCLVRAATTALAQNVMAYQLGVNIFYNTTRDINQGEELLVWYAPQYAKRLGKNMHPDGKTITMLNKYRENSGLELLSDPEQTLSILPLNSAASDQILHEEALDLAPSPIEVQSGLLEHQRTLKTNPTMCPRCKEVFPNQVEMVKHLRNHIMPQKMQSKSKKRVGRPPKNSPGKKTPSRKFECNICDMAFKTAGSRVKHMKTHEAKKLTCSQCEYTAETEDLYGRHMLTEHGLELLPVATKKQDENDLVHDTDTGDECVPEGDSESDSSSEDNLGGSRKRKKPDPNFSASVTSSELELSNSGRRVQPRRSLRGVRTTGFKAEPSTDKSDNNETKTQPKMDHLVKSETSPQRKRGRPRKYPKVESEEATESEMLEKEDEMERVNVSERKESEKKRGRPRKYQESASVAEVATECDIPSDEEDRVETEDTSPALNKADVIEIAVECEILTDEEGFIEGGEEEENLAHKTQESSSCTGDSVELVAQPSPKDTVTEEDKEENPNIQATENLKESAELAQSEKGEEKPGEGESSQDSNKVVDEVEESEAENGTSENSQQQEDIEFQRHEDESVKENGDELAENDVNKEEEGTADTSDVQTEQKKPLKSRKSIKKEEEEEDVPMITVQGLNGNTEYLCGICLKKFQNQKYLRLHAPAHTDRFRCGNCKKRFTRKENLVKHKCETHLEFEELQEISLVNETIIAVEDDTNQIQIHVCTVCNQSFDSKEDACSHAMTHHDSWKCDKCSDVFPDQQALRKHVCKKAEKHTCDICHQSFRNAMYLFRHMAMHTDIFKCEKCARCFSRKDSMQRHILKCCPELADKYDIHCCTKCFRIFATKIGRENHETNCKKFNCQECQKIFVSEEEFNIHKCCPVSGDGVPAERRTPRYSCTKCNKTFLSLGYLNRHKVSHQEVFKCILCKKPFNRREELQWHSTLCSALKSISENGVVNCDVCNMPFDNARTYRDHYQTHTHPYSCDKCQKRFIKIGTLHSHNCSGSNTSLQCNVCNRTFRHERYLLRHQLCHGSVNYECEVCHKKFFRKDYLKDHVCLKPDGQKTRIVRKGELEVVHDRCVCELCGKSFVNSSNLNKHMKTHGDRKCSCQICGKRFHYEAYLKEHIAAVHEQRYQYQCSHCGKVLKSKTGLVAHTKQFHSDEVDVFPCPKCGKLFKQKGNMRTHMYSHALERSFQCEFCHKTFKYPDQLARHKLIHTMVNKLQCEFCDKKFCKNYELRKHIQVFHSGFVYYCAICNARCGHRHTLFRHYKRKHPDQQHRLKEEGYVDQLLKNVGKIPEETPQIITIQESNEMEGIPISVGDVLPQAAAEALQSLQQSFGHEGIITSEGAIISSDGTINLSGAEAALALQGIQSSENGEQTVVILQIVNPNDADDIRQEVHIQTG